MQRIYHFFETVLLEATTSLREALNKTIFKQRVFLNSFVFLLLITSQSVFSQLAVEHFESGIPGTWYTATTTNGSATGLHKWEATTNGASGTNAVFVNPALDNVGQFKQGLYYLVTPRFTVPTGGELRFKSKKGTTTGNTSYKVMVSLDPIQSNLNGFSAALQTITGLTTSYTEQIIILPSSYVGQQVYFAFLATNLQTTTTASGVPWYLDDIEVSQQCEPPTSVLITAGAFGAKVTWVNNNENNFAYEVVPKGAGHGSMGTPYEDTNPINKSLDLTGLEESTEYDFYIKTNCTSNSSAWVGPISFKTKKLGTSCTAPLVIPDISNTPYILNSNLQCYYDINQDRYSDEGPNCIASNNWNYLRNRNNVFFSYTPTVNGLITITTETGNNVGECGLKCYSNANLGVLMYAGCDKIGVECLAAVSITALDTPQQISNFFVEAGKTYYIVLGSPGVSSDFNPSTCFSFKVEGYGCPKPAELTASNLQQTTANVSWGNPANFVSQWQYIALPAGSPAPTGSEPGIITTSSNTAPLTGLSADTSYDFYVRSVCDGTPGVWSDVFTFKTQCNVFSIPYYEDFTGASSTNPEPCWSSLNLNNDTAYWNYFPTRDGNTNETATIFALSTGINNNDLLVSPQLDFPNNGKKRRLRFKYNTTHAGGNTFSVKLSTTGIGLNDFTEVLQPSTSVLTTGGSSDFPRTTILIPETIYGKVNIAWVLSPGDAQASRLNIDDIEVTDAPDCFEPENFAVNSNLVTSTTAEFSWLAGNTETQWEIAIQPKGTGVPTGSGTLIGSNPYTATGLTPCTRYEAYVRAYCSGTSQSIWIGPVYFNTKCVGIPLPYCESFDNSDGNSKKFGWGVNDVNGDAVTWAIGANDASIYQAGINFSFFDDWLISPPLSVTAGEKVLSFDYKVGTSFSLISARQAIEVRMSTTGTNPSDFTTTILPLYEFTNQSYKEKIRVFNITNPGTIYLAFRIPPELVDPIATGILTIDNVCVEDLTGCIAPDSLSASSITTSSANLSWVEGYNETQWEVVVQESKIGTPTGNGVLVSAKNYVASGLSSCTDYDFYVRSVCNSSSKSGWVGPFTFRTEGNPFSTPFTETFDSDSTSEKCWKILNVDGSFTWETDISVKPMIGDQQAALWTNLHNNNDWLVSPTLTIKPNQRLRFYYVIGSKSGGEKMKVMLSPNNGINVADFTQTLYSTDSEPSQLFLNKEMKEKVVALPSITGNVKIAFQGIPSPEGQVLYIDNVVVEDIPVCAAPWNISNSQVADTSATIVWENQSGQSNFDLYVQPYGSPAPNVGSTPTHTASTSSKNITNLSASTLYEYYVRTNCGSGSTSEWVGPFELLTKCSFADQCLYTFILRKPSLTSSGVNLFKVFQNGQFVQDMGFPYGNTVVENQYPIYLCKGVEFSLFWDTVIPLSSQYNGYIIEIKDAGGVIIKTIDIGTLTHYKMYSIGFASCGTVTCPQPTNLAASATNNLSWTAGGNETSWEVYIQPFNNGTLPQSGKLVTSASYQAVSSDFTEANVSTYEYFVRAVCGSTDKSFWSGPFTFVRNNDPSTSATLPINATENCVNSMEKASFIGATASSVPTSCAGINNGDIWYDFVATSKVHTVELSDFKMQFNDIVNIANYNYNLTYPIIVMSLYEVQSDGSLVEKACSDNNVLTAIYSSELVIGNKYKVRLKLIGNSPNDKIFTICVTTPQDICNMDAANFDFEKPRYSWDGSLSVIPTYLTPGWRTNTERNTIFPFNGVLGNPYSNSQYIQLIHDDASTWDANSPDIKGLYKDFDTSEITKMTYSFAHANRFSGAYLQLYAGPPSGPFTLVKEVYKGDPVWELVQGTYDVPSGQSTTRFIFRVKNYALGHLLDAANFKAITKIYSMDQSLACGGATSVDVSAEGVGEWVADEGNPMATIIASPQSKDTSISGFAKTGEYIYHWKTRYCDEILKVTYQGMDVLPTVTSPVVYCPNSSAASLSASVPSGYSLRWYTQAVGGVASTTAPTPDVSTPGSMISYYVSAVDDSSNCEGVRVEIKVEVKELMSANISGTTSVCSGATTNISFSGTPGATVTYTINGGSNQTVILNGSGTATVPTAAITGTTTYALVSISNSGTPMCTQTVSGTAVITIALPTASISGTATICSGNTTNITFTGTPNATVNYTENGAAKSVVLDGTGNKVVTTSALGTTTTFDLVSVTSSGTPSCTENVTGSVMVTVIPSPTVTISGSISICSGGTADITFTGTPNAEVTYTINGGSNQTTTLNGSGTAVVPTGALTANATYALVSVSTTGGNACSQPQTGEATVTVIALPTASISGNATICEGTTTSLSFTGTPNAAVTYNDGSTDATVTLNGTGTATVITPALTATTTYTLVSVATSGTPTCSQAASGSVTVTVIALPTVTISGTTTICSGGTTDITFSGTPDATVTYTINGGVNKTTTLDGSGNNVVNTGALTANATYALVSVASSGTPSCSQAQTGTAVVTVISLPTASIANTSVCTGTAGEVVVTGTPNATVTYKVDGGLDETIVLNGSGSATITTPILTTASVYELVHVELTGGQSCGQDVTGSATVSIIEYPTATIAISGEVEVCSGFKSDLLFEGTPNATVTYNDGMDNQTVVLGSSGTATVTTSALTADTTFTLVNVATASTPSCVENLSGSVTITTKSCNIPKGISPNGDTANQSFDLSEFGVVKEVTIYNRYGVKVYSQSNYTNQWVGKTDSGEELPDGTYFYNIQLEDGSTRTGWVYINRKY